MANPITDDRRVGFIESHPAILLQEINDRKRLAQEFILEMVMNHPDQMTQPWAFANGGLLKAYDGMIDFMDSEIRKQDGKKK